MGESLDMEISGKIDEKFAPVQAAFENNFAEYGDVGASFAVSVEGEFVCDIWGGHLDAEKSQPGRKIPS